MIVEHAMKLTEHFRLSEFSVSATHPHLVEPVPLAFLDNAAALADVLQRVRYGVAAPIKIMSGYRSARLNRAVGGSSTSQHLFMEAVDFTTNDLPLALSILLAKRGESPLLGQVIYYPKQRFIHIALPSRRFPEFTLCFHRPPQFSYTRVPTGREREWLLDYGEILPR